MIFYSLYLFTILFIYFFANVWKFHNIVRFFERLNFSTEQTIPPQFVLEINHRFFFSSEN